jgi:putative SOS response-associated peptidase YedK
MCGRYATTRSDADLSLLFDAVNVTEGLEPSWNVAPTDPVPLVRISQRQGGRVLDVAKWGLVPPWSPDLRSGARMINARAETVATSPAFAPSFAKRRCLIPADGWYEWVRTGKSKQAYYMTPQGGSPLAFAGIWTMWKDTLTCSVITTAALGGLAEVHDRMPLILPRGRWPEWLAESTRGGKPQEGTASGGDPAPLLQPLNPAELAAIEVRPVRPDVGNVRNNGPELISAPVPEPDPATLF